MTICNLWYVLYISYRVDKMGDDKTKQNSQVESILVLTLIETRQHTLGCPLIAQQCHVVRLIFQNSMSLYLIKIISAICLTSITDFRRFSYNFKIFSSFFSFWNKNNKNITFPQVYFCELKILLPLGLIRQTVNIQQNILCCFHLLFNVWLQLRKWRMKMIRT